MKVQELFEATRVATDKGYYTPGYDAEEKNIRGTVKDWMARLGATKEDIAAAVVQARDLDLYAKLVQLDKSTGAEQKNGTFSFVKPGGTEKRDEKYMVYANGQIRSSAKGWHGEHRPTRLKAPKPRLVAGDAIKSLVKIYDGAFKELASKVAKRDRLKDEAQRVQVADLFEGIAKFSVEHQNGRHKRASEMTMNKIIDSILFSPAEKKRISKLEVGSTVTTQRTGLQGRTLIRVTRTS